MTAEAIAPPKTKSQALRSYDVADFPALTGLEEDWRFTPLKRLRGLAGATEAIGGGVNVELSTQTEGLTVTTVESAEKVLTPFDRISALGYGAATEVTLIEIAKDAVIKEPAVVTVTGTGVEGLHATRTQITVGRFAEASLVLWQQGSITLADNVEVVIADGARLNLVTVADWAADAVQAQHIKIRLGRDARVVHTR